jgi:hypothetical protein
MKQTKVNGRHGFVFHDACWSLLDKACHPDPVPYERLFKICDSLPFPLESIAISWGHDYGGPVIIDSEGYYPWEDRFRDREYPAPDPVLSANPYNVPEIEQVLTAVPQLPPDYTAVPVSAISTSGSDCFRALSRELCSAIAMYLPVSDALDARLASRAFWPIFYSQQFWRSRFKDFSDRSWVFEAQGREISDWRWLYRRTNDVHLNHALRNRKRIWSLVQIVLGVLVLSEDDRSGSTSISSPTLETSQFAKATGNLWEDNTKISYASSNQGCRLLHKHLVTVPQDLSRVAVSYIQIGDLSHITGMKLTSNAGDTTQLGYWTARDCSLELSELHGFNLAIGSRGIQALQCITVGGATSCWLGSPDGAPKTKRLAMPGLTSALEAGFDVRNPSLLRRPRY